MIPLTNTNLIQKWIHKPDDVQFNAFPLKKRNKNERKGKKNKLKTLFHPLQG